ncbi:exodeoxyribonuclease V subunit alpha [Vibrio maritimus]|uniref:exodeoxyribonuclease V subunit alpha n=1 Tax=Vibrio maritimus TaxID=990268 RepID=UPI001F2AF330|nr:exodeoxyribonuclease V subunit alpha [Vibrio maritimus]
MTTSRTFAQWIEDLVAKKCLRPLDYQFAKFVASIETQYPDEVMWLAALVSAQLGQGHICVNLDSDLTEQALMPSPDLIGLYGAAAVPLEDKVAKVDWSLVIDKASTISQLEAENAQLATVTPLVWQHHRLYLQRYFTYEQTIAERLLAMATPIELSTSQIQSAATMLDQLFAREYHYLYSALVNQSKGSSNQVSRQQIVCDFLDVIDEQAIDWERVESTLSAARSASDLQPLDSVIPLTACLNWQKVAAAVALTRRFAVISGGPGTGKTTTVTKLLAAMVNQANQQGESPTIKLVAPTGKAAARLTESIGKAVDSLALDPELKASIPTESSTLHRLLGAITGRVEFRHNQSNPLHLDVLVLDEASMVDLPMMHRLLDALPSHARLILLGDKDQLASVEAGAVLSDICDFSSHGYSAKQNDRIRALTQFDCQRGEVAKTSVSPLADSLCVLQKSYRFDARSGIGQLAKQVNAASSRGFEQVWQKGFDDIEWMALSGDSYQKLIDRLVRAYQPYLTDARNASPASESLASHEALVNWQQSLARSVLNAFAKARLLCAVRDGDFGVTGLNQRTESRLKQRGLIPRGEELWYIGRPLMVTKNDHGLGLYNGDIGICLWDFSADTPRLKVFFELPDGSIKSVLPSRMPEHETAYAMTIHKSQGSEFAHTFMILPADFSPLLTKELIYTGITRAKSRFSLVADGKVVGKGIRHKTLRHSGLALRLR